MPGIAQIPSLMAVSTDNTRDKSYLQLQVDSDPDFMILGQLFWNSALNRVYVKDSSDVVFDLEVKNQSLTDSTLVQLHTDLVNGNLEAITTLGDIQSVLIDLRNTLNNYITSKE